MEPPTSAEEMNELCRRCGAGDGEAFAEVYRQFGKPLYGTALRMLKSPEEAEDAMQETFLTFFNHAASLQPRNLGGWLHRVTVNHCLDRIRRRQRRSELELIEQRQASTPGSSLAGVGGTGTGAAATGRGPAMASFSGMTGGAPNGLRIDLERAIDELPERARVVLLLHDVEGLKHREIAEMLEISEGTSKSQLFRAREILRGALAPGAQDGFPRGGTSS